MFMLIFPDENKLFPTVVLEDITKLFLGTDRKATMIGGSSESP